MYYGEIKNCDIANGVGVRVSLFVSGCTNHCEQCFQPETWDFTYGKPFTRQTEETLLSLLAPSYIDGLTLLGGEPFEPGTRAVSAKDHLVLFWLYAGGADNAGQLCALRRDGGDAVFAGCAGGRPVYHRPKGHFAALSRL